VDFMRKRLPAQVGRYLEGVEFPARKEVLLSRLERNGVPGQIFAPLRSRFTEQKLLGLISKERRQALLTLKDLIEAGKLTPVIDRTYPLSEAPQAICYLEQGHAHGKVVLTVSN
jgi:NADPH:quinone reductase-like Zn-dependent oxidoreductase